MSDQGSSQENQEAEENQEIFFSNLPLEFIVSVILGQGTEADTPLCKAFHNEGIDECPNLLSMSQEDVENLYYHEEENGKTFQCHLNQGIIWRVQIFLDYVQWREMEINPVTNVL